MGSQGKTMTSTRKLTSIVTAAAVALTTFGAVSTSADAGGYRDGGGFARKSGFGEASHAPRRDAHGAKPAGKVFVPRDMAKRRPVKKAER